MKILRKVQGIEESEELETKKEARIAMKLWKNRHRKFGCRRKVRTRKISKNRKKVPSLQKNK